MSDPASADALSKYENSGAHGIDPLSDAHSVSSRWDRHLRMWSAEQRNRAACEAQDDKGKTRKLQVSSRQGYYMSSTIPKDTAAKAQFYMITRFAEFTGFILFIM